MPLGTQGKFKAALFAQIAKQLCEYTQDVIQPKHEVASCLGQMSGFLRAVGSGVIEVCKVIEVWVFIAHPA